MILTINIQTESSSAEKAPLLNVTFIINEDYPDVSPPDVSISSVQLTRDRCARLKKNLIEYAESLLGQPMIMDLIMWVKENVNHLNVDESNNVEECDSQPNPDGQTQGVTLLHLDHMRAKTKYIKTIRKWTEELALTGRLLFHKHLIFILLQGSVSNLKVSIDFGLY